MVYGRSKRNLTRGTKDMSYALAAKTPIAYKLWAERNPGYGPGALEAANEMLRASHGISNDPTMASIADINAELLKIRKVKEEVKNKEGIDHEDYGKLVAQEEDLLARKQKAKDDMVFEQKKAEVNKERNLTEVQIKKKEKEERRERAFAAKNASQLAAAQRPTGVSKAQKTATTVAARARRQRMVERALAEDDDAA